MKNVKFGMGMVFAALIVMVFAACPTNGKTGEPAPDAPQEPPSTPVPVTEPEITFGLAPESLARYMEEMRNNTDTLVKLLRTKKDNGEKLTPEDWDKWMAKTYLNRPLLTWNGQPIDDMKEIIPALNSIIEESKSFRFTKARIHFHFIPYDETPGSEWMKFNDGKPPHLQIDFIGRIQATIAYNGSFTMDGTLPHRRTCEPEL